MLLADPAYAVSPPGAPGPVGTMAWLRATASRFASGETHTRRRDPDGRLVVIDLAGHPFGAGPRRCPGEAHARALAAGVVEGAR